VTRKTAAPDQPPAALPTADGFDALLRVLEKRAPGLRKAGVTALEVGGIRAALEAPPPEKRGRRRDDDEDEDVDPGALFDPKAFRGRRRGGGNER
jgi:hypothetical protein